MKALRDFLDKIKPAFEKNKYLHTTYDAIDTFLFAPATVTQKGVHIRDGMDLKRTMVHVVLAMQLALLFGMYNVGQCHYEALGIWPAYGDAIWQKFLFGMLQMLPMIIVVHVVGLGIEFIFAALKGHQVEEGFLVSGMLIPLIMPADIPLWMVASATAFAVIFAKEVFGGTGMNILNVALTARAFVFFAYPSFISGDSVWITYDYNWLHNLFAETLRIAEGTTMLDGFSGATPLALASKGGWDAVMQHFTTYDLIWGFIPGSVGETSKVLIVIGALMLIFTGIGSWRVMLSMVLGCAAMGLIMNLFAVNEFMKVPFYYHFLMGGFFFAMAFMATDPVTAAQTNIGKIIYGFLIGVFGLIIRVINPAFPEGWMLAILFFNVFAPFIDHYVIQSNIKKRLSRA